ncbi:MAG: SHOCT domain-containing protein [Chloroflexi bacterium]|nr:SHOCT domain-containing protein [Chloroflexota bacterium]
MLQKDVVRTISWVALAILLISLLGGCYGYGMGPRMMHPGGFGNGYGGWGMAMGLVMLVFWALAIAGIVLLVMWIVRRGPVVPPASGGSRALEILQERYARGDIDKAQYEQIRRDLEGK